MAKDIDVTEITITEKQLLHILIDNVDYIAKDINFITEIAQEFYILLLKLYEEKLSFIPEHIFKYKTENTSEEAYQAIINTEYQIDKFEYYCKELVNYNLYEHLESKILKETLYELNRKGTSKLSVLKDCYNRFGETIKQIESGNEEEKKYLNFYDLMVEHEDIIQNRAQQIHQTTGCSHFDQLLPQVIPGLIILAGYSGSCKSTLSLYLEKQRIIKRLPSIAINTEMAKTAYNDSLLPSFIKTDYYDLLGIDKNQNIDYDQIINKMKELEYKYFEKNNYLYLNSYSVSINDVEQFILFARETMKLKKDKTLFCFIDLLSMLSDFGNSESGYNKAEIIEKNVNRINEFCLKNNVLTMGTLQLKRKDDKKRIERLEQVESYRPNASDIKSSGSWEERARMVLSIFNPWSVVHRNPTSSVIRDTIDPIIDIDINKDNYFNQTGKRISYLYQESYKTFVPYVEEKQ